MVEDECQVQARFSRDLKSMVHALQHVLAVPNIMQVDIATCC